MTGLSPFQPRRVLQVGSYIVLAGFLTLVLVLGIWNEVGDNIENAVDDELESFGAPEVSSTRAYNVIFNWLTDTCVFRSIGVWPIYLLADNWIL